MNINKYVTGSIRFSHSLDNDPKDRDFPLHVHDDYELYCMVSGDVGYIVEGRTYELQPGSLMIMRRAEIHKLLVYSNKPYERYTLNFSPEILERYGFDTSVMDPFLSRGLGERNSYEPTSFFGIDPIGVFRQMDAACEAGAADEESMSAYLLALLYAVNLVFKGKSDKPEAPRRSFDQQLISYVNEHLFEDISLTSISEDMHISASQINRIFNRLTGTSVYNYIVSKRLVYAREMICGGESAVNAGQACGFNDYSSFFRLYKKRFGCSPADDKSKIGG